jgi:hypothetical protein
MKSVSSPFCSAETHPLWAKAYKMLQLCKMLHGVRRNVQLMDISNAFSSIARIHQMMSIESFGFHHFAPFSSILQHLRVILKVKTGSECTSLREQHLDSTTKPIAQTHTPFSLLSKRQCDFVNGAA